MLGLGLRALLQLLLLRLRLRPHAPQDTRSSRPHALKTTRTRFKYVYTLRKHLLGEGVLDFDSAPLEHLQGAPLAPEAPQHTTSTTHFLLS